MGPQQFSLQGDAVAIPAGELQHGLKALIQQQLAHRQAAHAHHRPAAIGDIDGMDPALQARSCLQGAGWITTPRWGDFRRDGSEAAGERLMEQQAISAELPHHACPSAA